MLLFQFSIVRVLALQDLEYCCCQPRYVSQTS